MKVVFIRTYIRFLFCPLYTAAAVSWFALEILSELVKLWMQKSQIRSTVQEHLESIWFGAASFFSNDPKHAASTVKVHLDGNTHQSWIDFPRGRTSTWLKQCGIILMENKRQKQPKRTFRCSSKSLKILKEMIESCWKVIMSNFNF